MSDIDNEDDGDEVDDPGSVDDDDGAPESEGEVEDDTITHPLTSQRLVRVPRRVSPPPPLPKAHVAQSPAAAAPAARATRPRRRPKTKTSSTSEPPTTQPVNNPIQPPAAVAAVSPAGTATDGNILLAFEETLKVFPAASQTIAVERKTGNAAHWMVTSRPRTANELYDAIRRLHGRNGEITYEITFRDAAGHGSGGLLSMPSTLDEIPASPTPAQQAPIHAYPHSPPPPQQVPYVPYAPQQPPPASPQALPPPPTVQVVPPSVNPVEMMQELFKVFQQMQSSVQPPPQPQPQPAPVQASPQVVYTPTDPLASMQQMFEIFRQIQGSLQPAAPSQPPPPPPQMPPPPPQGSDPAAMTAWMHEMFRLFRQMQATATPPAPPSPPPSPAQPQPQMMGMPPMQPPPGTMFVPGFGFVPTDRLFAALSGPAPGERVPYAGPYAGPRNPYAPPGGGHGPAEGRPPYQPPSPPQRPQTPSEQLRDAVGVMRSTFQVAREFQELVGSPQQAEPSHQDVDDDSPVRVIDMGPAKGVINRNDGSLRGVETFMANLPDIIKFVGETGSAIRKARDEDKQQRLQKQQQQLPPGYVVAGPDYRPPDGFVAVRVDQIPPTAQESLPEPPDEMPPPISENESRTQSTWGLPPTR